MRFYTIQHTFYCGIEWPVDWAYRCGIDANDAGRVHHNIRTDPQACLPAVKPCRGRVVGCVESLCTWHWLVDLCEDVRIPSV